MKGKNTHCFKTQHTGLNGISLRLLFSFIVLFAISRMQTSPIVSHNQSYFSHLTVRCPAFCRRSLAP